MMKSTLLIRLFNGVWLCVLFYLLWIYPYLDSPTPIRDILKVLLAYFMPLALAVALAFWSQLRLMKKHQNSTLPPLPTNWREQVPPEWVKLTLQSVTMAIVSVVLGMVVFSLIFKQLAVWIFGEF